MAVKFEDKYEFLDIKSLIKDLKGKLSSKFVGDLLKLKLELIDAPLKGSDNTSTVIVKRTRQHYGGYRYWFICPDTNQYTAKLYITPMMNAHYRGMLSASYIVRNIKLPLIEL